MMSNEYECEELEVVIKTLADLCKTTEAYIKERLSYLKEFASEWFELLPESTNAFEIKTYPAVQFTKGKQFKNFMLSNKPRRLCVRTNC